jgi:hypothetical protein
VDRGTVRNYIVKGMKREALADLFEDEIEKNGFQIQNRQNFHNSTMISAQTGSYYAQKAVDFMISAVLQGGVITGTVYTTDVDIIDSGLDLQIRFAVAPILEEYEGEKIIGPIEYKYVRLTGDPASNRLLERILNGISEKGVVFEELQSFQQKAEMVKDGKYTDQFGWTVQRSEEPQLDSSNTFETRFWALITSIIGFIGSIILAPAMVFEQSSYEGSLTAFLCIGFLLSVFGAVGFVLSIMAMGTAEKGKRAVEVASMILSIPPVLVLIIAGIMIFSMITEPLSGM